MIYKEKSLLRKSCIALSLHMLLILLAISVAQG